MVSLLLGIKVDVWVCVGEALVEDVLDGKRKSQHYWVMTRESTSIDCQKWGEDEEYKNTGSVKFWEVTVGKPVVPPMANRWEGRDDRNGLSDSNWKIQGEKEKKARQENKEIKMRRKRKSVVKDEDSDEDDLPLEEDMLTFMKSLSHKKRKMKTLKVMEIFLHKKAGRTCHSGYKADDFEKIGKLGGESWGKADERVILKDKADDFEKARQAEKTARDKKEAEYRAQLRAALAEEYHERMEFDIRCRHRVQKNIG